MRGIILAGLLVCTLGMSHAAVGDLPAQYPTEPDEAVALFLYARETLKPATPTIGEGEIRPSDYTSKAVELQANLAGRIVVNAQDPSARSVIVRLALLNGQCINVNSTSELTGMQEGDSVRAILDVPPAPALELRFRLRGIVLEYDLPRAASPAPAAKPAIPAQSNLARAASSAPATTAAAGSALPPEYRDDRVAVQVPSLAKFSVPTQRTPRTGQEGAWDPVGNVGYPVIDQRKLEVWTNWVRRINSKLSDRQADWICRWVIYYSAVNGVDHRLMFAMMKCESDFDPFCVSRAGAVGLTQLMPCNLQDFRVANKWNVQDNIRAGVEHFSEMLKMWSGRGNYEQFALAAASYNAGPNRVKRCGGIPDITETKNYVKKLGDLFYQLCKDGYP